MNLGIFKHHLKKLRSFIAYSDIDSIEQYTKDFLKL